MTHKNNIPKIAIATVAFIGISFGCIVTAWQQTPTQRVISPIIEVIRPVTPQKVYYDCPLDKSFQDHIRMLCDKNNIPMDLVLAVIEQESSFRPGVVSGDDYGLMQINKINHDWLNEKYGITNFLDPYQNAFCGITMLSEYYHKYQNVNKALMAYNIGEFGARALWEDGVFTTSYTEKVKEKRIKYETRIK